MKIVQLSAENIKRLKAVSITPDGNLVVIGGNNAQGKSSVLDAIAMAIGGSEEIPERPIRDGQSKAEITLDLGELIVTRKLTAAGGPSLIVKGKDGVKLASPQTVLDRLTSRVSFDPLAFQRMDAKDQTATLRKLVGLDFSAIDAEKKRLFDHRTEKNREVAAQKARLASMTQYAGEQTEEVSIADLTQKLHEANAHNGEVDKLVDAVGTAIDTVDSYQEAIDGLEKRLKETREKHAEAIKERDELKKRMEDSEPIDTNPIMAGIREADHINRRVRENAAYAKETQSLKAATKEANDLTEKLEAIEKQKAELLAKAPFPVPGLAFDDSGVLYQGIPFAQASGAEQLRVSVAMGIAMNPTLKVLLIRDGSLLDETNLEMIAQMAAEADAQVWLERVGKGDEVSVVIEDGEVSETRIPVTAGV
jgi:energy-coupling factor transporter ATP-binding protein EcfA2